MWCPTFVGFQFYDVRGKCYEITIYVISWHYATSHNSYIICILCIHPISIIQRMCAPLVHTALYFRTFQNSFWWFSVIYKTLYLVYVLLFWVFLIAHVLIKTHRGIVYRHTGSFSRIHYKFDFVWVWRGGDVHTCVPMLWCVDWELKSYDFTVCTHTHGYN